MPGTFAAGALPLPPLPRAVRFAEAVGPSPVTQTDVIHSASIRAEEYLAPARRRAPRGRRSLGCAGRCCITRTFVCVIEAACRFTVLLTAARQPQPLEARHSIPQGCRLLFQNHGRESRRIMLPRAMPSVFLPPAPAAVRAGVCLVTGHTTDCSWHSWGDKLVAAKDLSAYTLVAP